MRKRRSSGEEMLRVVEIALQAIAIFMCALILHNMSIESSLGIPTHACVEYPLGQLK